VKKFLIVLLKIGISAAIVAWMVGDAMKTKDGVNVFANLVEQHKHWAMLAAAWTLCMVATLVMFVRWWYLVRALEIPCRFADAVRISFWGFLFNLAPLGIVGGDLVKAALLAHEQRRYRARAVASVLIDRVIGLYLLLVVASTAILLTGFWRMDVADIRLICHATFALTVAGAVGIAVMLTPGVAERCGARLLGRIPRVGPMLESLSDAVRMLRHKPGVLIVSSAMSVGVHCLSAAGCYLIARGLPGRVLALSSYFVIMPLSGATCVLPLPLGPLELVLEFLYTHVPTEAGAIATGQGLLVALGYRLMTLLIAALGICYYFGNRRQLAEVIHEAGHEDQSPGQVVTIWAENPQRSVRTRGAGGHQDCGSSRLFSDSHATFRESSRRPVS